MKNYFKADFYRVLTKKSRICLVVFLAVTEVLLMVKSITLGRNAIELTNSVGNLEFLYVDGIMLANIWISFGDDIRAKSMQAALGTGIKRWQIVLTKWLSITLIAAIEISVLTVLQFLLLIASGKIAGSFVIEQVICGQLLLILMVAIVMPLTMIILFQTQKAILGVLVYFYLIMAMTSSILDMAVGNTVVQKFQLWNIGAVNQAAIFLGKLLIGQFDIRNFLMLVFYFAIGFGGTMYLFRKKELDF